MDSKTRAKLRAFASQIKPSVIIGKEGISENLIKQIGMDLDSRELVKVSVLESEVDYKAMLDELCVKLKAEPVCYIGKKLVLYRYSTKKNVKHILENA